MRNDADDYQGQDAIVAVPIAEWMDEGLPVYDVDGAKIGVVRRYDLNAGYMEVETGGLARQELYVPFHLMQSITPREIYLRVAKEAITDANLLPPAATPRMEERRNADAGSTEVVLTHEIPSGYDGSLVQIAPVPLDEVKHNLVIGMTVRDVDDEYVGEVTHIDPVQEVLVVKEALVDDTVRQIPLSQIARVDPDDMCVTLLVPKVAL
ncbi:MAG TPA: hypothetical protein VGP82_18695 [Ktedonobacterales bacterium]|jgi:hypothetical protein|nr:hypothetical protein [Ktedonobacterales bacterium]